MCSAGRQQLTSRKWRALRGKRWALPRVRLICSTRSITALSICLVDEFQDTSRAQYELVKALTEQWSEGDNRSLFLVGDPMQSIYRFREAEIALFLRCWHEKQLGSVRLEQVALKTNFRSTPELIGWVQHTIGPIMAEEDPRLGRSIVSSVYSESKAAWHWSASCAADRRFWRAEAAEIVRVIKDAPAETCIAILVVPARTSPLFASFAQGSYWYKAIEIEALKEQQHVMDVLSLTRACCIGRSCRLGSRACGLPGAVLRWLTWRR